MIMMTKATALAIQAEQVAHYSAIYGPHVADIVAAATNADALSDGDYPVATINRFIPRGAAIEALIPAKAQQEARYREMTRKQHELGG